MFNYKQTSYGICISMSNSSFLLNDVHEYSPFSISKEYINHSYFYEYFFYILSFLVCFISYLPKNVQRNCFAIICLYEQHLKNLVANIEPKIYHEKKLLSVSICEKLYFEILLFKYRSMLRNAYSPLQRKCNFCITFKHYLVARKREKIAGKLVTSI